MRSLSFEKVLIVRTDRIGDVVLTLPMVTALQAKFPACRISMLVQSYTRELVDGYAGIQDLLTVDAGGARKSFFSLLRELKNHRFDLVFVVHPSPRLAILMFLAGIPLRVGTGFRWYSLFLNRRVYEHRKKGEKHEAELNLSLLKAVGCDIGSIPPIELAVAGVAREAAAQELNRLGIRSREKLVIVHPGSGGSARDWSPRNFGLLAKALKNDGFDVVVTGSATEGALVDEVVRYSDGDAVPIVGRLSLKELAAFIGQASLFISNSTGPLHIAAAVGVPVIAMYPPIPECSPRRWGPLTEKKVVFVADNVLCERCKGGACQGDDCMNQITVDRVLQSARQLLTEGATIRRA